MKRGKIIILVLVLVIITVIGAVGVRKFIDNRVMQIDIKKSKRVIYSETKKYFNILDYRHLEMRDNEKLNNIEGAKDSANGIIKKINEMEKEIDDASWCRTRSIDYNADCNLYKVLLKEEFGKTEEYTVIKLKNIENPEDKEILGKMQAALEKIGEEHEKFHKKRDEFLAKNYN